MSHSTSKDYDLHFSAVLTALMKDYYRVSPSSHERELFDKHAQYKKI
jgi:hypothetical protein